MLTTIGNILNLTDIISNYLNGAVQGVIIIAAVWLQGQPCQPQPFPAQAQRRARPIRPGIGPVDGTGTQRHEGV